MSKPRSCRARQYSDQMQCARCGLAWDMNDPDPPACRDEFAPKPKKTEDIARLVQIVAGIATTAACLKFLLP